MTLKQLNMDADEIQEYKNKLIKKKKKKKKKKK